MAESFHSLAHSAEACDSCHRAGTPTQEAGTQLLEPSQLPPRASFGFKLDPEARARCQSRVLQNRHLNH